MSLYTFSFVNNNWLFGRHVNSEQTSCSFLKRYSARPTRLNTEPLLKDSSSAATKVLVTGAAVDRKYLRFRDELSEVRRINICIHTVWHDVRPVKFVAAVKLRDNCKIVHKSDDTLRQQITRVAANCCWVCSC